MNAHSKIGSDVVTNGREYARPRRPTVVICRDGSEPAYIEAASAKGLTPHLDRIMKTGASTHAYSALPSFTNPTTSRSSPAVRRRCTASAAGRVPPSVI